MFTKHLFILLILLFSYTYSQKAAMVTEKIFSNNQQFHVQLRGGQYEGFVGDQEISLIDSKNDTLWKKVVPGRFLIHPAVSNQGDVAITHREIKIYDKNDNLKGISVFKKRESPYHVIDYMGTVHKFSLDGTKYFIFMFTGSPNSEVGLYCLNDSAKVIWKTSLGKYRPSKMMLYKNKIISHDCGLSGVMYTNYCYIFNEDGDIIWKYSPLFKTRGWKVSLDNNEGILLVKDKATKIKLKLDILKSHID